MKDIWGFLMGEINITMNAYTEFSTNVKTIVAKLTTLLEIRNKTRLKVNLIINIIKNDFLI